jgi:Kef-type K+ transport system membrane component KefB
MPDVSFNSLAVVLAVAFFSRLVLGLVPRFRVPGVVIEISLGIIIGPSVLGWAKADEPVQILALVGLAFLLFLSGLEIELDQLRGRLLRVAALGLGASVLLGLLAGYVLDASGLISNPLLVGVTLVATSLGLVIPVLKEGGFSTTPFGQLVIVGATLGDFTAVLLLSLLFSRDASGTGSKLILLGVFVLLLALVAVSAAGLGRRMRISQVLVRLQDTTAQIRVRGAMLLLVALVVVAEKTRPGDHPGSLRRRGGGQHDRPGRQAHPSDVPGEAGRHRLWIPRPDLLHHEWHPLRPRRAA